MAVTEAQNVRDGKNIDYTPGGAISGGQLVVQNDLVGIAPDDLAASVLGSLMVEGMPSLPKDSSVFAVGDPIYWDDTTNQAKADPAVGKYVGFAALAAATGDARVYAKLDPSANFSRDLLYSSVAASAAVSNTVAETAFDKAVTIPANTLRPGDVIRVRAQVIATLTNVADTLDVQLRLGTTDVVATGAVDVANGDIGFIDFDITIRTIGAGGTMVGAGHTALGAPGTVTSKPKLLPSTAIDTTVANSVNVSATWSAANAGNSCRLDVMNVQLLRK